MNLIGIDLGADSVRYVENDSLLFDEPGWVAYDAQQNPIAIGVAAQDLIGQTHVVNISQKKHLLDFLDLLFVKMNTFKVFSRTDVFVCFPGTYPETRCEEICAFILKKGAHEIIYDQAIWCAALGSQLDISKKEPICLFYIDQQEATLASLSQGEIKQLSSSPYGGLVVEETLKDWIWRHHHIQVSTQMLKTILEQIGQIIPKKDPLQIQVRGIDGRTQKMTSVLMDENMVAHALEALSYQWANWIYSFLQSLDTKSQQHIAKTGLYCCGKTATLNGLGSFLQSQLQVPFQLLQPADKLTLYGIQSILLQWKQEV